MVVVLQLGTDDPVSNLTIYHRVSFYISSTDTVLTFISIAYLQYSHMHAYQNICRVLYPYNVAWVVHVFSARCFLSLSLSLFSPLCSLFHESFCPFSMPRRA